MSVTPVRDTHGQNFEVRKQLKLDHVAKAVAAEEAIGVDWPPMLLLDPDGGATVLLPPEADSENLVFFIFNTAGAAETLTVEEDSSTTAILTLLQGESGMVYCDGTAWRGMMVGANT